MYPTIGLSLYSVVHLWLARKGTEIKLFFVSAYLATKNNYFPMPCTFDDALYSNDSQWWPTGMKVWLETNLKAVPIKLSQTFHSTFIIFHWLILIKWNYYTRRDKSQIRWQFIYMPYIKNNLVTFRKLNWKMYSLRKYYNL